VTDFSANPHPAWHLITLPSSWSTAPAPTPESGTERHVSVAKAEQGGHESDVNDTWELP
jgi:hypothetical protein